MKLRIVVNYAPRYRRGHLFHFVPPVTGIHLPWIEAADRQRAGAACGGGTGADNPPRSRGASRAAVAESPQPGGAGPAQAVRALHSVLE